MGNRKTIEHRIVKLFSKIYIFLSGNQVLSYDDGQFDCEQKVLIHYNKKIEKERCY